MRLTCSAIFLIAALNVGGCKPAPTEPARVNDPNRIILSQYGISIDTSYYTNWSDGSWEKFGGLKTIGGVPYVIIADDRGTEYYYSPEGYAGWKDKGEDLILYSTFAAPLPDTVLPGEVYYRSRSFKYNGYTFVVNYMHTIKGLTDLQFSYMKFTKCLEYSITATITVNAESQTSSSTYWEAMGPSTVKQTMNNTTTIAMTDGFVNGTYWKINPAGYVASMKKSVAINPAHLRSPFRRSMNMR